ncbi:hypothetical protein IE81DRAFT_320014, partial [Ceraceosorus guamensis]
MTSQAGTNQFDQAAATRFLASRWDTLQNAISDPSLIQADRPEVLKDKPPVSNRGSTANPKQDSNNFLNQVWKAAGYQKGP